MLINNYEQQNMTEVKKNYDYSQTHYEKPENYKIAYYSLTYNEVSGYIILLIFLETFFRLYEKYRKIRFI